MSLVKRLIFNRKFYSTAVSQNVINGKTFESDAFTNITPRILSYLNRNLYKQPEHPLCLLKERIFQFFYNRFKNSKGNAIFSVYEDLNPIVTTQQNFDSLLIPTDHPSRAKTDCYYLNKNLLLRGHMTAHQSDLIKMGLNNFLMLGDVYRRDEIDSGHYPVFHQLDGVRLFTPGELFSGEDDGVTKLDVIKLNSSERTEHLQESYTERATKMVEAELKGTLEDLMKDLFGKDLKCKWVDAYFPFTHPSWELEILLEDKWIELLGCGIVEHKILKKAGCNNRIGWAFGIGLDRLAMVYYLIPDIRIFWSTDPGFLHQFQGKTSNDRVKFVPFSAYPACPFDVSFWIQDKFEPNDFYELVRDHCKDLVEQIQIVDIYKNPKTGKESRCYRLVYRSLDRVLSKSEVQDLHNSLCDKLVASFNVQIR